MELASALYDGYGPGFECFTLCRVASLLLVETESRDDNTKEQNR